MVILPLIIVIGSLITTGIIINAIAYIKMKYYRIDESICENGLEIGDGSSSASSELSLNYSADDEDPLFDDFPDYPHSI